LTEVNAMEFIRAAVNALGDSLCNLAHEFSRSIGDDHGAGAAGRFHVGGANFQLANDLA
jgi:hypothetical protein